MPLINLSYSANLEQHLAPKDYLLQAHEIIATTANTDLNNCKSTINCQHDTVLGDNAPHHAFIVLTVELLVGRTDEVKRQLSEQLLALLKSCLVECDNALSVQLSCHIKDLDAKHYYKDKL